MNEVLEKCLSLFFSLMILGNAFLIRKMVGTWLFPACIYSLFWFGYTFFPLLFVFTAPSEPLAMAFILLSTIAFSLSSISFDWKQAITKNKVKAGSSEYIYNNIFLKTIFYTSIILSFIFLILNSLVQEISIYDIIFNFFQSAEKYTQMRYADEIRTNIFGQLSLVLSYMGVVIGGLLFSHAKTKRGCWTIISLSFLPSIFIMVTQSAKGAFLLAVVLFYASVLVNRIFNNEMDLLTKKTIKAILLSLVVIIPILVISFMSRGLYGYDIDFVLERLKAYFASYSFGHLYAFSDWFSFYIGKTSSLAYPREESSYGFYTFMSIFKLLGSDKLTPIGVFDDYYSYKELLTTNIYTIYRGLILDFGIVGSLIYMYVTGFFLHLSFYIMMVNKKPVITIAIFIFSLGYFYTSFLISLLIWNSIYVSFALLCFILFLNSKLLHYKKPLYTHRDKP